MGIFPQLLGIRDASDDVIEPLGFNLLHQPIELNDIGIGIVVNGYSGGVIDGEYIESVAWAFEDFDYRFGDRVDSILYGEIDHDRCDVDRINHYRV
jgi:hypothetical protein